MSGGASLSDTGPPAQLQDAIDALLAKGHTVEPIGDDFGLWLVDGGKLPFSDAELITYAYTLGLVEQPTSRSSITGRPSLDTS